MHQNNESGSLISTDIYGCLPIEESYNYSAKGYIKTENANEAKFGIRYYTERCESDVSNTEYIDSPISGTLDWTINY